MVTGSLRRIGAAASVSSNVKQRLCGKGGPGAGSTDQRHVADVHQTPERQSRKIGRGNQGGV